MDIQELTKLADKIIYNLEVRDNICEKKLDMDNLVNCIKEIIKKLPKGE
jgi:hypothetical protein